MAPTIKQPVRWMRDNIFVNDQHIPYAIWQLDGQPYGLGTVKQKQVVRARHQELFQNLTGEYSLMGLVATESPDEIVAKMLEGVKNPSQEWLAECALTRDQLMDEPSGSRLYFLVAPLSHNNLQEATGRLLGTGADFLREVAAFTPAHPTETQFETWTNRAISIEKKIPAAFQLKRVGITMMRWITHHLSTRGGNAGPPAMPAGDFGNGDWINTRSCLPEVLVDEGDLGSRVGDSPTSKVSERLRTFRHRYARVETGEHEPSYQQFGVIGFTPQTGFMFPGSEFINVAAELPLDIDFCIRLSSTPAAKVRKKNRRAEHVLKDQYDQQGATSGDIVGGTSDLGKAADSLREYTQALSASEREVEVAATMIFSTSGPDADSAERQMRMLRDLYGSDEWEIVLPLGGQRDLFWDCWPGSVESSTGREMKQITTGESFSMGVPITSDILGGMHGFRLATNITTGRFSTVLVDLAGLAEKDISGSFAAVGELGSGKSVMLKSTASYVLDRGAQAVIVDRSDNKEYAALAQALTEANIIDFSQTEASLDPLRIYADNPQVAMEETLNLMTLLLHVAATDPMGIYLSAVLRESFEGNGPELGSLKALRDYLASDQIAGEDRDLARNIYRLMDVFSNLRQGRAFFDETLPPMHFDAQATVFCTRGLDLPSQDELSTESGRRELTVPKQVGRAVYAYLASVAQKVMYADDSRETLFLVDEAHHMTGSPEGMHTIKTMLKTGRKHKGAVGLGTHSADELGDAELRGLIPQRFLFRTRDPELAAKNLKWLDPAYNNPEYIEMLTKDVAPMNASGEVPMERRGECLYRDHLNRVGKIKIMIPREPNRAETVLTSPPAAA